MSHAEININIFITIIINFILLSPKRANYIRSILKHTHNIQI